MSRSVSGIDQPFDPDTDTDNDPATVCAKHVHYALLSLDTGSTGALQLSG